MRRVRLALGVLALAVASLVTVVGQTPAVMPSTVTATQLFQIDKIWDVHLTFTEQAWADIQPPPAPRLADVPRPPGVPGFVAPEGMRNGVSGFRGVDFKYVHANVDFQGQTFNDVAVRFKGNGTFPPAANFPKPSFKIDLNKYVKGQKLAGLTTINLHNGNMDPSWLNEVLAFRLYRDAGIPAPRTAYARVFITVGTSRVRSYNGLYSLVENVDEKFTEDRYKVPGGAIYKPVTTALFHDDGKDWKAYNQIYDPKTDLTPADQKRVLDFADIVTHASDQVFASRFAEFVDLDAFARYMAVVVWFANPDSLLTVGQNYYLYLHPTTNKFHFIPWDQDHSFGQYIPWSSPESQQELDILRPARRGGFVTEGQNQFVERVFALDAFKRPYLARLAELTRTLAQPARIAAQVDEIVKAIAPSVEPEPRAPRVELFKKSHGEETYSRDAAGTNPLVPIKVFVKKRDASVQAQLLAAGVR